MVPGTTSFVTSPNSFVYTIEVSSVLTGGTSNDYFIQFPQTMSWGRYPFENEWAERETYAIQARNRHQRRILQGVPDNASQIVALIYGRRGKYHKLGKWDALFFEYWSRQVPKQRKEWMAATPSKREAYTSSLRRFAGGRHVICKA